MHIATHFFASWLLADAVSENDRERGMLTLSGVLPDIDVLPAALMAFTGSSQTITDVYQKYHHVLAHNFTFAIILSAAVLLLTRGKYKAALWAFIIFHLHLLFDLLGSAGPDGSIWALHYLYPFSPKPLVFNGQWALNAWPNIVITLALMAFTIYQAKRKGYSPLVLISKKADRIFVETLRNRFKK
jgi:hypothetical protein